MDKRIENVIEITWIVRKHSDVKNLQCISYGTLKELIGDFSKKFELLHKNTDWKEKDYLDEITRFTNKKLALELWKRFCNVPMGQAGTVTEKEWNGFPCGTSQETIWRWFEGQFGVSIFKDLLRQECECRGGRDYTVCLLFTPDMEQVLLIRKEKTIYAGLLNGIGGKVEDGELPIDCARREIREESGITELKLFCWLGALTLPESCEKDSQENRTLYFYAGVFDGTWAQPESGEQLELCKVSDMLGNRKHELAGNGDLEYFIRKATQ